MRKLKERRRRLRQSRKSAKTRSLRSHDKSSSKNPLKADGLVLTEHPFAGIPEDVMRDVVSRMGETATANFPKLIEQLRESARHQIPTYFLGSMAWPAMFAGSNAKGETIRTKGWKKKLEQYHIELAQAVFLTIPAKEYEDVSCHPSALQELSNNLFDISEAYRERRFSTLKNVGKSERDDEERALLLLQERVRLHTQGVRNWAYYSQALKILKELYEPVDKHCIRITGIACTDFIKIFSSMLSRVEDGVNEHRKKIAPAFRKTKPENLIADYHRCLGLSASSEKEFLDYMRDNSLGLEELKSMLLSHSMLHLIPVFEFSIAEISDWIGRPEDVVRKAMDFVSYQLGDLSKIELEHLFLGNPIWEKPVRRCGRI